LTLVKSENSINALGHWNQTKYKDDRLVDIELLERVDEYEAKEVPRCGYCGVSLLDKSYIHRIENKGVCGLLL
jgi:hypothetical protein